MEHAQVIVVAQAAEVSRHVYQGWATVDVLVLVRLKQLGACGDKLLHGNTSLVDPADTDTDTTTRPLEWTTDNPLCAGP